MKGNWSFAFILIILLALWTPGNAQSGTMPSDDRPVVILGASYAASWPIKTIGGRRVINKGVDGNQSFEMAARFGEDVLKENPAQVLLWGFINDIFRSDQDNLADAKKRVLEGYKQMIASAEAHGIEVLVATEVTIREPSGLMNWVTGAIGRTMGKTSYQDTINGHVSELNGQLKELAQSHDITVLDFADLLADSDGRRKREFAIDDGSHLSKQAYESLSAFTMKSLKAESSAHEVE